MKNKNVVLYGVIALVAVVAIAFFTGTIPPKGNLEGTIGGANRYQSQQIADQDVVLKEPAVQAFLQSDLFHQIQANPELARNVLNTRIADAMRGVTFARMLGDQAALTAVQGDAFRNLVKVAGSEGLRTLFNDPNFCKLLIAADAAKVTTRAEWAKVLAGPAFDEFRALRTKELTVAGDNLAEVFASGDMRGFLMVKDNGVLENLTMVCSDGFLSLVESGDLAKASYMPIAKEWNQALAMPEFQKFLAADGLRSKGMLNTRD